MKLQLTLQSDTIIGCGEGLAGIIDRDITFDEYGFPYIPAKRLKGILREAAIDYLEVAERKSAFESEIFKQLFGSPGVSFSESLILGNGYLCEYQEIKSLMEKMDKNDFLPYFTSEYIREYYSYTRAQTTIERASGTAQDDTLRVSRVLKKQTEKEVSEQTFVFDVAFRNPPDKEVIELLKIACKLTRHIGLSRTRGFGEVKLELQGEPEQKQEAESRVQPAISSSPKQQRIYSLPYVIHLHSQAICSANVDGNNTISDRSISGSAILGAFAWAYLKKFGFDKETAYTLPEFRHLFLEKGAQFLPAYCTNDGGERLLPTPVTIVAEKQNQNKLYDLLETPAPGEQTQKFSDGFCVIEYDGNSGFVVETASPEREMEYHHARPGDRSLGHAVKTDEAQSGQFFQFEVLKAGQCFQGLIIGTEKDLNLLKHILPHESTFYIGKSKTAQYGQTRIEYKEIQEFTSEIERNGDEEVFPGEFVVTLTSPMILINENGHASPEPGLFVNELQQHFKHNSIRLDKSFLRFVKIGGFLAKWGLPRQQVPALDAGSVIVLHNGGNSILIKELEHRGYGLLTEQGYGRIVVDWHGNNVIRKKAKDEKPGQRDNLPEFPSSFKNLTIHILKQRLESEVREKAMTIFHNVAEKYPQKKILTNSLLGKLQLIFQNRDTLEDINQEIDSFQDIAKEKLNKLRIKVGDVSCSFSELLERFCKNNGQQFHNDIILQTSSYNTQDHPIADIREKLGEDAEKIIDLEQLVQTFFTTFLTYCELHNRGAEHE